jgi:hypothetical protein
MYAREYELLWCLSNELCSASQQENLPPTTDETPIGVSTPQAMLTPRKIITRKISMVLDP